MQHDDVEFHFKIFITITKLLAFTFLTFTIGLLLTPKQHPTQPTIGFLIIIGVILTLGVFLGSMVLKSYYDRLNFKGKLRFKKEKIKEVCSIAVELLSYGSLVSLYALFTSENLKISLISLMFCGFFVILILAVWIIGYKLYKKTLH